MSFLRAAPLAILAFLFACGDETPPAPPVTGWVDVAGMICADGSPTGIGISPGTANRVLVFLNGGGACWSETACDASPGPFGRAEFDFLSAFTLGTIFDRTLPGNPFIDWTLVFVAYCTGDVHAGGDVSQTYGAQGTWRHQGRANLELALARIAATFPAPEKLVIAGSSAGGFGSLLAFDIVRSTWPAGGQGSTQVYLVDDSGQTFVGNDLQQVFRDAWWASWNLDATVTPLCAACKTDLSEVWTTLSAAHPSDRFALLSTTRDLTMRRFFGDMPGPEFETGVTNLAVKLDGLIAGNAATFIVGGADELDHALFLAPAGYVAGGETLLGWLDLLVTDDPGWGPVGP